MKDLDKIKELVATCDSQNIELAIAIGVNMEGYDRNTFSRVLQEGLLPRIEEWFLYKYQNIGIHYMDNFKVYGVNLGKPFVPKVLTEDFCNSIIDSYLSL